MSERLGRKGTIMIHRILVRVMVKAYVWAYNQGRQTALTRAIRAAWRRL